MSSQSNRLELLVDILDLKEQRTSVLTNLKPVDLIQATLDEFQELDHLGKDVAAYRLYKLNDETALNDEAPLGEQLSNNTHLVLTEWVPPAPAEAEPIGQMLYLSDEASGEVYKLTWFPAIIGRLDASRPENELVAVNLESHEFAQRVSRRHVKITYADAQFWIQSMSSNATEVIRGDETIPVTDEAMPLRVGDSIYLKRSKIALKMISS